MPGTMNASSNNECPDTIMLVRVFNHGDKRGKPMLSKVTPVDSRKVAIIDLLHRVMKNAKPGFKYDRDDIIGCKAVCETSKDSDLLDVLDFPLKLVSPYFDYTKTIEFVLRTARSQLMTPDVPRGTINAQALMMHTVSNEMKYVEDASGGQSDVNTLEALFPVAVDRQTSESEESARPFKFVNRESECEQLAEILLTNHNTRAQRGLSTGAQSQYRLTLATSAQMFGSGKSTFGENFLKRLKAQTETKNKLRETYGATALQWLLGLDYVALDFRYLNPSLQFIPSIRASLIEALSSKVTAEVRDFVLEALSTNSPPLDVMSSKVIKIFEEVTGRKFFVHLDEVSSLGPFLSKSDTEVTLLYKMWAEISAIHNKTQSEVFCSGRRPSLFLLGKGYCPLGKGRQSPENAECVLLDPLKEANLRDIFEDWLVPDDEFIRKLHYQTSGVPRFVAHAVDFFTDRIAIADADQIDYGHRREVFMRDTGPFVEYLKEVASSEMNPLNSIEPDSREFYVELIRVATLCLPLCLEKTIDGKCWGFPTERMTLDVCSAFPLYLQRLKNAKYHFLVIPPLILDQIAKESSDSRLPFWSSLYKVHPVQALALSSGDVLEIMIQHILRLRVSEELHDDGRPLCESLPFLRGSKIGKNTFTYKSFRTFPKITKKPSSGKSLTKLKKFFDNPNNAGFTDVHPDDLERVLKLLENNFFYVPLPKSSSCDLLFKTDQDVIVEKQFKNGRQEVNSAMMAKELEKSCCFHCTTNVVFVMIALTTPKEKLPNGANVTDSEGNILALLYGENTTFDAFVVPSNLEVIVVLEPGLVSFLTQTNVDVLRKSELDLNDMVLATQSPSKNKNKN